MKKLSEGFGRVDTFVFFVVIGAATLWFILTTSPSELKPRDPPPVFNALITAGNNVELRESNNNELGSSEIEMTPGTGQIYAAYSDGALESGNSEIDYRWLAHHRYIVNVVLGVGSNLDGASQAAWFWVEDADSHACVSGCGALDHDPLRQYDKVLNQETNKRIIEGQLRKMLDRKTKPSSH